MPLRLIEVIISKDYSANVCALFDESECDITGRWVESLNDDQSLIRLLLPADQTETVSDKLGENFGEVESFRMMFFKVEATLPQPDETQEEEEKADTPEDSSQPQAEEDKTEDIQVIERINREELYADAVEGAKLTRVYMINVVLSAVVAAIGLVRDDVAVIIGAMVIAPLLRPNVALAMAAVLGHRKLAVNALKSNGVGLLIIAVLSIGIGFSFDLDWTVKAITSRTEVDWGHIILALAAGAAGALSFTTGVSSGMIGVMVAVALLPPLVVAGLLTGSGDHFLASGAFLLFVVNVTCVNLAAVVTFLIQGLRPREWVEEEASQGAGLLAIGFWIVTLLILIAIIYLLQ